MRLKRFADDRYLRIAFIISGISDILLGLPMIISPDFVFTLLNVTKPEPTITVQLIGLFLVAVGYFLLFAIQNVRKFIFIGVGSAAVRLGYAALVLLTFLTLEIEMGYIFVAMTDIIIAIILLVPIALTEGISWKHLWQL